MKALSTWYSETRFRLLVNMARSVGEGTDVYRLISLVADRFLNIFVDHVTSIPTDHYVSMSVCRQRAVLDLFPHVPASREFLRLASAVGSWETSPIPNGSVQFFRQHLTGFHCGRR
jgi:flagellar biosynthesis protein FlhG